MAIKCMEGPFVFRLNDNGAGPHLLVQYFILADNTERIYCYPRCLYDNGENVSSTHVHRHLIQVCTERGWREYAGENNVFKDRWNLWWRSGGFPTSHYRPLLPWQFVNRIPKGNSICRKDRLIRHLKRMKKIHGLIYDFSPVGYNLPSEYTKLAEECNRCEKDDKVWICKPVGQSQGKGIFLFRKLSDLSYDNAAVVQRYIENPLLIGGYKFDLRLYVCVPSYHPLTIYLYKEGLARFATEKFSLERLDDPFRHLTNFSLNKLGPGYSEKKERIGAGCKWTFRQLRRYFEQAGYFDWILWQRISCLVTLTILSQAAGISKSSNCFEFFGFDVLIDENLKPWLLEVNLSPALSNDCEVDSEVKKPLLHDLFDLLGLPVCNTGLSLFTIWSSLDRIENDSEVSSKLGRSVKKRSKLGREVESFLNLSSETRATLRQSTPDVCPATWPRYNSLLMDKYIRRYKGNKIENNHASPPIWDNGRDWKVSCVKEGGWIRICPFIRTKHIENAEYTGPSHTSVENEIKNMVISIQKYLKAAKEVQQRNEKLTDEQCNALLQNALELNTEIWLPEK